jgi:hypothetical protein
MRLVDPLRQIDPLDPDAPVPDGEALLTRILASPVPVRRSAARRAVRTPLALVGVACFVVAGIVLALPRGAPTDALAAAYAAVSNPDTVLHYREHWVAPGSRVSPRQNLYDVEVWQAGNGSRGRTLTSLPAQTSSGSTAMTPTPASTQEDVWSSQGTRSWNSRDEDKIIVYDAQHAPALPSLAGAYVGNPEVGDPRTLLYRAQGGDTRVTRLADGTVRGIPVLRFRVGRCQVTRTGPTSWSTRYAAVVSIDRVSHLPVRVEQPPCREASAGQKGLAMDEMPGFTIDFVSFDVLPADAANQRLLEMSPHPGAKVVDGAAIDAAEAREDETPTATPTPRAAARARPRPTPPLGASRGRPQRK